MSTRSVPCRRVCRIASDGNFLTDSKKCFFATGGRFIIYLSRGSMSPLMQGRG